MNSFGAMIIARTVSELQKHIADALNKNMQIGFVPTMGALHKGHIALAERCVKENDWSVCSVFVNPTQFNNPEDLKHYPRTEEEDLKMLEKARCQLVFIPSVEEMYPNRQLLDIHFGELENILEGKYRPGHFQGVATIVYKLFRLVNPHRAYFGEKDFQQLMIIMQLVRRMNLTVEIIPCPTVREADGLALSSRNIRLTSEERQAAPVIYQVLITALNQYRQGKEIAAIREEVKKRIEEKKVFALEYFEIASIDTSAGTISVLQKNQQAENVRAFIAVHAKGVRLIDNMALEEASH
jgi:pantoate--beta-alanine ligase